MTAEINGETLKAILKHLEFVEGKQIGIWANGGYVTWNDGEYEVSVATKKLRNMLASLTSEQPCKIPLKPLSLVIDHLAISWCSSAKHDEFCKDIEKAISPYLRSPEPVMRRDSDE